MPIYTRDLVKAVAHKSAADEKFTRKIIDTFFETMADNLARGEKIVLPGYISAQRVERAARQGRNPQTGEVIDLPARYGVKLTAGTTLKNRVR